MKLTTLVFVALALPFLASCGSSNNGNSGGGVAAGADSDPSQPYTVHHGKSRWRHWNHPGFQRPDYNNWDWEHTDKVRCSAVDSKGKIYVVIEDGYRGKEYKTVIVTVEDQALDRCHADSRGDEKCRFQDCNPG